MTTILTKDISLKSTYEITGVQNFYATTSNNIPPAAVNSRCEQAWLDSAAGWTLTEPEYSGSTAAYIWRCTQQRYDTDADNVFRINPTIADLNNVQFTRNSDGSISLSGTASATGTRTVGMFNAKSGKEYYFYGGTAEAALIIDDQTDSGHGGLYTATGNGAYSLSIKIFSGKTYSITIKPIIRRNSSVYFLNTEVSLSSSYTLALNAQAMANAVDAKTSSLWTVSSTTTDDSPEVPSGTTIEVGAYASSNPTIQNYSDSSQFAYNSHMGASALYLRWKHLNLATYATNGIRLYKVATGVTYKLSEDTTVNSSKNYYTYNNGSYTKVAHPTGNPSAQSYYEGSATFSQSNPIIELGYDIVDNEGAAIQNRLTFYDPETSNKAMELTNSELSFYSIQNQMRVAVLDNNELGFFGYTVTSDITVDSNKTYYTRQYSSSTQRYEYTEVSNPSGNPSIQGYYTYGPLSYFGTQGAKIGGFSIQNNLLSLVANYQIANTTIGVERMRLGTLNDQYSEDIAGDTAGGQSSESIDEDDDDTDKSVRYGLEIYTPSVQQYQLTTDETVDNSKNYWFYTSKNTEDLSYPLDYYRVESISNQYSYSDKEDDFIQYIQTNDVTINFEKTYYILDNNIYTIVTPHSLGWYVKIGENTYSNDEDLTGSFATNVEYYTKFGNTYTLIDLDTVNPNTSVWLEIRNNKWWNSLNTADNDGEILPASKPQYWVRQKLTLQIPENLTDTVINDVTQDFTDYYSNPNLYEINPSFLNLYEQLATPIVTPQPVFHADSENVLNIGYANRSLSWDDGELSLRADGIQLYDEVDNEFIDVLPVLKQLEDLTHGLEQSYSNLQTTVNTNNNTLLGAIEEIATLSTTNYVDGKLDEQNTLNDTINTRLVNLENNTVQLNTFYQILEDYISIDTTNHIFSLENAQSSMAQSINFGQNTIEINSTLSDNPILRINDENMMQTDYLTLGDFGSDNGGFRWQYDYSDQVLRLKQL